MVNDVEQLVQSIIKEQALIIGPLAWLEAKKVTGLQLDIKTHDLHLEGDARQVLEALVQRYERLFGPASREVCREAVRPLVAQIPADQIPAVLR